MTTFNAPTKTIGTKKAFVFRGCHYTFDTKTRMIEGHMVYHVAHAEPAMVKFLASTFPAVI